MNCWLSYDLSLTGIQPFHDQMPLAKRLCCSSCDMASCWWVIILAILSSSVWPVLSLGTLCTTPLGPGTASEEEPYWQELIEHRYVRIKSLKCNFMDVTSWSEGYQHSMKIAPPILCFAMSNLTGRWEMVSRTIRTQSSRYSPFHLYFPGKVLKIIIILLLIENQ